MALTLAKIDEDIWGKTIIKWYNITLDSSYPTNGYKASLGFSARAFGLKTILSLDVQGIKAAASGVVAVVYDYFNVALMAFRSNMAAHSHDLLIKGGQAAAGTDVLTVKTPVATVILGKEEATDKTVVGGSASSGGVQATTAAGANLVEVANTTSLSGVIVRVRIEGYGG